MEQLSREELLGLVDLPYEQVELRPGKFVYVQGMSGIERDAFEASLVRGRGTARRVDTRNVRARLAVRCVVDKPAGARVFGDADLERLGKIRADVLQKIFDAAQRLSGVSDEDVEELGKLSGSEPASQASAGGASSSS